MRPVAVLDSILKEISEVESFFTSDDPDFPSLDYVLLFSFNYFSEVSEVPKHRDRYCCLYFLLFMMREALQKSDG